MPDKVLRSRTISVRVSKEEWNVLDDRSAQAAMNISTFVRTAALRAAGIPYKGGHRVRPAEDVAVLRSLVSEAAEIKKRVKEAVRSQKDPLQPSKDLGTLASSVRNLTQNVTALMTEIRTRDQRSSKGPAKRER